MAQKSVYDHVFKLVISGDTACGKSSLLSRYIERKFDETLTHTIGVEFGSALISLEGKTIKLQIWDTAGQERFRSITRSYYRSAFGCLLVYDVTRRETFHHIASWLSDARSLSDPNSVICLVGNKCDLPSRSVSTEEGRKFAEDNGLLFIETSAKDNTNVEDLFVQTAFAIFKVIQSGGLGSDQNNPNTNIKVIGSSGSSGCSC
ncbi:hypothetical protein RCL1_007676 [Eukaryota sp. TZLM3-RCL]